VTDAAACGQVDRSRPAGLLRRLAALGYDALLLAAVWLVLAAIVVGAREQRAVEAGTWWWQLCLAAATWLFFAGFWTRAGQTLGMRAWKLKLERDDGGRITLARATLRFAAAWLSALPAGAGYWWAWLDPERRTWHDRLSRTRVVLVAKPVPTPRESAPAAAGDDRGPRAP
jgi:uncharacterized RDD family membrane protein YckC